MSSAHHHVGVSTALSRARTTLAIACVGAGCATSQPRVNAPTEPASSSNLEADPAAENSAPPDLEADTSVDERPGAARTNDHEADNPDATDASDDDDTKTNPDPLPRTGAVTVESVYRAGEMKFPEGRKEKKAFLVDLERWNNGGYSDGTRWHAVPRVVIGEPSVRSGKIDPRALMKRLRAEQYMTVRNCFDAALRDTPDLSGRTVLRLKISGDRVAESSVSKGKVSDARKHPTAMSPKVASCLADAFDGVKVNRARSASATVLVSIDLWPGDAPMPASPRPAQAKIDVDMVQKIFSARTADVSTCTSSEHGAWGRLALEVEVNDAGAIIGVDEVESTFPVRGAAACLRDKLKNVRLDAPRPAGTGGRVIVAFRVAPR